MDKKCHQFHEEENVADTSKDELLLGGGICHVTAMLQLTHRNKQVLLAYVTLF